MLIYEQEPVEPSLGEPSMLQEISALTYRYYVLYEDVKKEQYYREEEDNDGSGDTPLEYLGVDTV